MARRKSETREEYNARMNAYMKVKYANRRLQAIEYLGGKCSDCGATHLLEFDHIKDKEFNIAQRLNAAPWKDILAELDKCALRCVGCHGYMTASRKMESVDLLGSLLSIK